MPTNVDDSNLTGAGFTTINDDDKLVMRLIRITAAQVASPPPFILSDTINQFKGPDGKQYYSTGSELKEQGAAGGAIDAALTGMVDTDSTAPSAADSIKVAIGKLWARGKALIGSSGLTMNTARLLGRTTASAGAVEEMTVGTSLSLSGGALNAALANQAEAEAGADAAKLMTPQRVAQAIAALAGAGGGIPYLGAVAATANLTAFASAKLGQWANVGASESAYVPYGLKTLPGSVEANWQALSGTISSGSVFSIEIVQGMAPLFFAVSAPVGDVLTVTIGGVTQPRVIGAGIDKWTFFRIADPNGAALPSSVTVQRTTGAGTTGLFALNGGPSTEMFPGEVATYADLLAIYPNLGADIGNLPPGWRVFVRAEDQYVRVSADSKFWVPELPIYAPKSTSPAGTAILMYGPAGHSTWNNASAPARKVIRASYFKLPYGSTAKAIRLYLQTVGVVGATTSGIDFRVYEVDPNGSPLRLREPLYVWSANATGTGTGATGIGTGTPGTLDLTAGAGTWKTLTLPGGNRRMPSDFIGVYTHDYTTTAPVTSTVSLTGLDKGRYTPTELVDGTVNYNMAAGYAWSESGTGWTLGERVVFPAAAELIATSNAVPAFGFELV